VSPSGRLPFSLPGSADHLPPFEPRATQVTYDLWHGYRRLGRAGRRAAYPFGFGLSYSRFELSDLRAEWSDGGNGAGGVTLAVTLANRGPMAAAEVVQVYLEPPGLRLERPPRTLVGFRRLELAAGERCRVTLEIPLRRLACFEEACDGFVLEAGEHRLVVARHVEDPGLVVTLPLPERRLGP
jgi:beta-glucosidase